MENRNNSNGWIGQKQRREALIEEGVTGKTIREILPNTWFPWTREAEAMYFKSARDFLKTSLAYNIMNGHQDIADKLET